MGLGDWACLQIETQEVDLSWNSFKSRLTSLIVQAIDGLPDAAISSFSRAVYRPNVCVPQFPRHFNCMTLVDFFGEQGILHWSSSSWIQLDWSKAVSASLQRAAMFENDIFAAHQRAVSRKPLAFVLFREALLSGCQIYHERFEGPIKALIIVLTLTRSKKSRIAMAWHVKLYPRNPCTS